MRRYSSSNYPQFEFKSENIRDRKTKYDKHFRKEKKSDFFSMKKVSRQPLVSDEMLIEIKSILSNLRISAAEITWKVVIVIGNNVLRARCPEKMDKNSSSKTLSTKQTWNALKSFDWIKRNETTAKKEMNPALYKGIEISWKNTASSS